MVFHGFSGIRSPGSGFRRPLEAEDIEKLMKINDFRLFLIYFPESGARDPDSGIRGPLYAENNWKIYNFRWF